MICSNRLLNSKKIIILMKLQLCLFIILTSSMLVQGFFHPEVQKKFALKLKKLLVDTVNEEKTYQDKQVHILLEFDKSNLEI